MDDLGGRGRILRYSYYTRTVSQELFVDAEEDIEKSKDCRLSGRESTLETLE